MTAPPRPVIRRRTRTEIIALVVRVALATTPSPAAARRTLAGWPGHHADPAMRQDALDLLDSLTRETTP